MSLLLAAILGQTVAFQHRMETILPVVEFEHVEVREALRQLFLRGMFAGSVAPDVQGTITVSLRNVPWSTALQNVTRQVDASYRIDHDFFEVVRREQWDAPAPLPSGPAVEIRQGIEAGYRRLRYMVATGQGPSLAGQLRDTAVVDQLGKPAPADLSSYRIVVDTERKSRGVDLVGFRERSENVVDVEVLYSPKASGLTKYFRDRWKQVGPGDWRLIRRRDASLVFKDAELCDVVAALFEGEASVSVDAKVHGKVTADLTGQPFEVALQNLCRMAGATYLVEGGVYRIVPRDPTPWIE